MTTPNRPTPPDWCEPDAVPDWQELATGDTVRMWERVVGRRVWIAAEDHTLDGNVFRTPPRIFAGDYPDGLSVEEARELAAELLAAADILDSPGF